MHDFCKIFFHIYEKVTFKGKVKGAIINEDTDHLQSVNVCGILYSWFENKNNFCKIQE